MVDKDKVHSGSVHRGSFYAGFLAGLLAGLLLALAVAIYVSKVPTPFLNKVPGRSAEQDAADAERARNWDPNAALSSQPAPKGASGAAASATNQANLPAPADASNRSASRPADLPVEKPDTPDGTGSAKHGTLPLQYYVQIGAYARGEDAEQQRAKLAMSGLSARVTERDQGGRVVYRVRMGPFDIRDDAEHARDQAATLGYSDATLIPVQR